MNVHCAQRLKQTHLTTQVWTETRLQRTWRLQDLPMHNCWKNICPEIKPLFANKSDSGPFASFQTNNCPLRITENKQLFTRKKSRMFFCLSCSVPPCYVLSIGGEKKERSFTCADVFGASQGAFISSVSQNKLLEDLFANEIHFV